ncbi:MAG: hypothetical protein AAF092_18055 [Pseudomonadota bacterium]
MRSALITLICALLVLTSAGVGVAKGTLPAADGIVICRGHGTHTVWIDAQGEEVAQHALCAEGVQSMMLLASVDQAPSAWTTAARMAYAPWAQRLNAAALRAAPQARGPPADI